MSIGQAVGELINKRAEAPTCNGDPLHGWVRGVVDPDEDLSAAAIRVCFEPDRDEIVTVRVVNNRTFSQRLQTTTGDEWAWTWPGPQEYGPEAIVYDVARAATDSRTVYLLPPLAEVAIGIDRPVGGGQRMITARAGVDAISVFTDVVAYVFDQIPVGGSGNVLVNVLLQVLFECGGKQALSGDFAGDTGRMLRGVVDAITGCAAEIVRSDSDFGALFEELSLAAIEAHPGIPADVVVRSNRLVRQLANAFRVLRFFDLTFYMSDQLANAMVGPLSLSIRGDGRAQPLGAWQPTCNDLSIDSNRLYRNLALQDAFLDLTKELWEFPEWQTSARTAVAALSTCTPEYLMEFASFLPTSWADPKAARIVANEVRQLAGASALPAECISVNQARSDAARLLAEAGITPTPTYAGLRSPQRVTCIEDWALVEEMAVYPWDGAAEVDYFALSGEVLLRWDNGRWVGVSANMYAFDCGSDGCTGEWPTNVASCRQAPPEFRAKLEC